ncbi:hypothetical protein RB195_010456 [Necator americanus]|uniref:THAP-type domain-containing protein n=1 Tax=Necator americanus TaxID=51031 RepID=A0ABR1CZ58_NECAM
MHPLRLVTYIPPKMHKKLYCGRNIPCAHLPHCSDATMTEPISVISIVDDACTENDEDGYEEMEEEDEEIPLLDDTQSVLTYEEVESAGTRKSLPLTTPHCIVCCRTPTPKVRLFKWPEDRNLRKSWLAFFHLGLDHLDGCKASYICNIHFDANQFLYEGDRVYWRRDSFPRFRQRRSILAEPFPWEVTFNADKRQASHEAQPRRLRREVQHEYKVAFRESFFKSKSKSSHPVAVVSLPGNPNVFYEFSYTRTSSVDSSKFYSCLSCRKAKIDTRVKDVIRTIHIKDGIIRSRGDPFWGHHFACRPFTSADVHDDNRVDGLHLNYFGSHDIKHVEEPPSHEQRCRAKKRSSMQHMQFTTDDPSLTQLHGQNFYKNDVWGEHGPFQLDSTEGKADIWQVGKERYALRLMRFDHLGHNSSEQVNVSNGSFGAAPSKLIWFTRQRRSRLLPQCHLCRKVVASTKLLIQHLQRHLKLSPNCRLCGSKMSPDSTARVLRARKCCKCTRSTKK